MRLVHDQNLCAIDLIVLRHFFQLFELLKNITSTNYRCSSFTSYKKQTSNLLTVSYGQ
jgi:hypothetical protein